MRQIVLILILLGLTLSGCVEDSTECETTLGVLPSGEAIESCALPTGSVCLGINTCGARPSDGAVFDASCSELPHDWSASSCTPLDHLRDRLRHPDWTCGAEIPPQPAIATSIPETRNDESMPMEVTDVRRDNGVVSLRLEAGPDFLDLSIPHALPNLFAPGQSVEVQRFAPDGVLLKTEGAELTLFRTGGQPALGAACCGDAACTTKRAPTEPGVHFEDTTNADGYQRIVLSAEATWMTDDPDSYEDHTWLLQLRSL